MKLRPFLFLLALTLNGGAVRAQDVPAKPETLTTDAAEAMFREQLSPTFQDGPNAALRATTVSLQAQTRQIPSAAGLTFQLDIFNPTEQAIKLDYLLDKIQIRLRNEKGEGFYVQRSVERDLSGLSAIAIPADYRKPLRVFYKLLSVTSNGRELTPVEIREYFLVLEPKGHLILHIGVDRVIPFPLLSPNTPTPADTPATLPAETSLPAGVYRLELMFSLYDADWTPQKGIFHSKFFHYPRHNPAGIDELLDKPLVIDYRPAAPR